MTYRFYPDVFWVTNFVMDFLVLVLMRFLKKSGSPIKRLVLSAGFGATGSVVWFLLLSDYQFYQLLMHLLWNPVMLRIAFPQKKIAGFLKDLFMTYIWMALLGGILNWGFMVLSNAHYFWLWILAAFGIAMLAIQGLEAQKLEKLSYEILLQTEKETLCLKGFLDTGNLLLDPLINKPVHIIQEEVLKEILRKEETAVRYIPFHSLGQEQGILPVVTLKGMYMTNSQKKEAAPFYIERPVLGLAKEKLFQKKDYQIILNARNISI